MKQKKQKITYSDFLLLFSLMALKNTLVKIVEVNKITPPLNFPDSVTELTLPLTFFDTFWFKFHPVERIFFYQISTDSSFFNSVILPKLKHSLSITLLHFLPLAGNLIWPSHSPKPFIFYTLNDGVSLTVAESDADFDRISGKGIKEADTSHGYIPELFVSEKKSATVSFQITNFPNRGFCIGVSSHHSIFDGKSIIMFLKAWAHICRQIGKDEANRILPPDLTPVFDRRIIQDPEGLEMVFLNNWVTLAKRIGLNPNPRSLELIPMKPSNMKMVRGTFDLSGEDVKKLRQKVVNSKIKEEHLSTFVLTYAYVAFTIVKSKGLEKHRKLGLGFMADCRSRLDPPLPGNYFGNCVCPHNLETEAGFLQENGFVFLVHKFNEAIKGIEKGVLEGAKEKLSEYMRMDSGSVEIIGVAGSHRFGVYGTDFGWGRPNMVEVTSIDKTGSISMAESPDGDGGVELGLVLDQHQMEIFASLFAAGLEHL